MTDHNAFEQAFTRHSNPNTDGHTDWTGPTDGRGNPNVWAQGKRRNGLHMAFRLHHHREPQGRVRRTCTHPGCITDHTIRQAHRRADTAYDAIFGPGL
ncbi:MAG TPA: hypothetical protein VJM75_01675 [Acidimicrobiales bacterium]|nr:hypothetical protein [Acidimicrobiales bacterium]